MRTVLVVLLLGVLCSCGGIPPIEPPEPPPPCEETGCPDGQVCEDGKCRPATCLDVGCPDGQQCLPDGTCVPDNCPYNGHPEGEPLWPWCKDVGQQCSSEESPCRTNPSQDPYYCEEAVKCDPLPRPQCVLADDCDCYEGQTWKPCTTPPVGCPEEMYLIADSTPAPDFHDEIFAATSALGDRTGRSCRENLDALGVQLRKQMPGRCVIAGKEAVFIERDDGLFEENHTCYFGDGSWTNNWRGRYVGCHRNGSVVQKCPSPWPNMSKMKFNYEDRGSHLDTTLTTDGQPEFCASIGYCCMPGTGNNVCGAPGCIPRGGCPVRPECGPDVPPDAICHQRAICEKELCNQKWECNGQPAGGWRGNPAQSNCRGHFKTWCANAPNVVLEGNR